MTIQITGDAKEIAALVLAIQERRGELLFAMNKRRRKRILLRSTRWQDRILCFYDPKICRRYW